MLACFGHSDGGDVRRSIDRRRASPRVVRRFRIDDSQQDDNVMDMVIQGMGPSYGPFDHSPVHGRGDAEASTVTDSTGASGVATGSIVANPSPPAAPSGLTASQSGTLVVLAWQDNSSNETVFYIERCQGVGCTNFGSFVATQWPNVPSYTDYSAVTGERYSYRVRAYNSGTGISLFQHREHPGRGGQSTADRSDIGPSHN